MSELLTPELRELLALKLEAPGTVQPNYFEISGYPDREAVVSNWYRFFFDSNEPHGLGTLFLDALRAVHDRKYPDNPIEWLYDGCVARTEITTQNRTGRVDILLEDSEEKPEYAVIIENKVYAGHESNPFPEYFTATNAKNATGILLTLQETQPSVIDGFKNITHAEFHVEVRRRLGDIFHRVPSELLTILSHLFQNVESLMSRFELTNELKVMAQHGPQLLVLEEYEKNSLTTVKSAVANLFIEHGYKVRNNSENVGIWRDDLREVKVYFTFKGLFRERTYGMHTWVTGKHLVEAWNNWRINSFNKFIERNQYAEGWEGEKSGNECDVHHYIFRNSFQDTAELMDLPKVIVHSFQVNWENTLLDLHKKLLQYAYR